MLKRACGPGDMSGAEVRIGQAVFPAPFASGLEFSSPARGVWNIVHTGMLIPGAHQIYICARGCLRGVILTAAEMNAMERMSWVALEETDLFDGRLETGIEEGVAHILRGMKRRPPCVLVFISCVQQFAGMDFPHVLDRLRAQFPETDFVDCYMNPTMRKSGPTPDQIMRRQLYAPLKRPEKQNPRAVSVIGNDLGLDPECELVRMIRENGYDYWDITLCRTYEEYKSLAESALLLTTIPAAVHGASILAERLGVRHLDLTMSCSPESIESSLKLLAEALVLPEPDFREAREQAEEALRAAKEEIGDTPIALDYTAVPRPVSLARLLLDRGFRVTRIYADVFLPEERDDFEYLRKTYPDLTVSAAVHAKMRFAPRFAETGDGVLAIGQKAAWFCGTRHFVNIVSGGGLYGYSGLVRLAGLMLDAFREEKNTEEVIRRKGFGCESCLP